MSKLKMRWCPYSYQKQAVQDLLNNPNRCLWFFPGEGKTSCTLAAIKQLKERGDINKTLIVAPLSVAQDTWPKEIDKWSDFEDLTYTVLHGKDKEKRLSLDVDIYIINFEGLKWLLDAEYDSAKKPKFRRKLLYSDKHIITLNPDLLVVDEISKCKDPFSLQTKSLRQLAEVTDRHIGLTGTPAANSLMDIFGQTLVIDGGASLGQSITKFRNEFFIKEPYGFKWDIKPNGEDSIRNKIAHLITQKEEGLTDVAKVPDVKEIPIYFDLPKNVKSIYDELKSDFIAYFNENEIDAANAAAKTIKLRQIASGGVYTQEKITEDWQMLVAKKTILPKQKRKTLLLHSKKSEILNGLIEGHNGHPLLVFYHFIHDVENIKAACGDIPILDCAIISDGDIIAQWNAGKLPVLLAHPKSVGYGLNLQYSGANVCFYTLDWSYELHEQALRRVVRQGNPSNETVCYYLLGNDTIEPYVLDTIRRKERVQNNFMQSVRDYHRSLNPNLAAAIPP